MNQKVFAAVFALAMAGLLALASCERPTEPAKPNGPPDTRLANVPLEGDTIFPVVTMNWDGGDNDGFIAGFQFRYITYHQEPGTGAWKAFDSTGWADTIGASVTVAFNSSEPLNRQIFLVRAVDNSGNVDPSPASKLLYTTRAAPPVTTILYPQKDSTVLAATVVTDWWPGLRLLYSASDPTEGGKVVDYAWSADDGPWHVETDTLIYVAPGDFKAPLSGRHTLKVVSRNNTNLTDPVGATVSFNVAVPTFDRKILIIDETDEFNNPFITTGTPDAAVDAYYAELFPGSDSWDYKTQGMPPREVLARYQLLVWVADDLPASAPHKIAEPRNIGIFTDYLNVGGKFIMTGWRILKSFGYAYSFPFTFPPGSFVYDYLHIATVTETDLIGDCTGGYGKPGAFSSFRVDSVKLALFPYSGKLSQVNLILSAAGFTDILYSYVNDDKSPFVQYRGRTTALRYYGTVYDAVVLGFPMYFVNKEDALRMAQELLVSLHVN